MFPEIATTKIRSAISPGSLRKGTSFTQEGWELYHRTTGVISEGEIPRLLKPTALRGK